MAMAIDPQKRLPASGIIASTAAMAVRRIGRSRLSAACSTASRTPSPACSCCLIWSINMTELRMMMPNSAMIPSMTTKPNGRFVMSSPAVTPIMPSGAVSSVMTAWAMFCSCTMRTTRMSTAMTGTGSRNKAVLVPLSSEAPSYLMA